MAPDYMRPGAFATSRLAACPRGMGAAGTGRSPTPRRRPRADSSSARRTCPCGAGLARRSAVQFGVDGAGGVIAVGGASTTLVLGFRPSDLYGPTSPSRSRDPTTPAKAQGHALWLSRVALRPPALPNASESRPRRARATHEPKRPNTPRTSCPDQGSQGLTIRPWASTLPTPSFSKDSPAP